MKGGPVYGFLILCAILVFDLITSVFFTVKIASLTDDFKTTYQAYCDGDIALPTAADTSECGGLNYTSQFLFNNYQGAGFNFSAGDDDIITQDQACSLCFNVGQIDPARYQSDQQYRNDVMEKMENPPAVSTCRYFCPPNSSSDCWCVKAEPIESLTGFPGLTENDCPAIQSLAGTCSLPYDDIFSSVEVNVTLDSGDSDLVFLKTYDNSDSDMIPSTDVTTTLDAIGAGFDSTLQAARQQFNNVTQHSSLNQTKYKLAELVLSLMNAQKQFETLQESAIPTSSFRDLNGFWQTETQQPFGGNNVIHIEYEGLEQGTASFKGGEFYRGPGVARTNDNRTIIRNSTLSYHSWRIDIRPHAIGEKAVQYMNKDNWFTGKVRSVDLTQEIPSGFSLDNYVVLQSSIIGPAFDKDSLESSCLRTDNSSAIGLSYLENPTQSTAMLSFNLSGLSYLQPGQDEEMYANDRAAWFATPSTNIGVVTTTWSVAQSSRDKLWDNWLPFNTLYKAWAPSLSFCEAPVNFTVGTCTDQSDPETTTVDFFRCFLASKWILKEQSIDYPVNSASYQMQNTISDIALELQSFRTFVQDNVDSSAFSVLSDDLINFADTHLAELQNALENFLTLKRANELYRCGTDRKPNDPRCVGTFGTGQIWTFPGFKAEFNNDFLNTLALVSICFNALSILVLVPLGIMTVRTKLKDRRAKKMKREGGLQQSDVRQLRKQHLRNMEKTSVLAKIGSFFKGILVLLTAILCFVCVVKYTQAATSEVTRLLCASLNDYNSTYHAICGNHVELGGLGFMSMVAASLTLTFIFVNSVRTKFKEGKEAGRYAIMLSIVLIAAIFIFAFVVKPEMTVNEDNNRPSLYGLVEYYPVFAFDIIALLLFSFLTASYCWKNSRYRMNKRKSTRQGHGSDARKRWDNATGRTHIVTSDGTVSTQQGPLRGPNARAAPSNTGNIWESPQRSATMPTRGPDSSADVALDHVQLTSLDVSGGRSAKRGRSNRRAGSARNL